MKIIYYYFTYESKAHSFRLLAVVCMQPCQDTLLLEEQFSNIAAICGFNQVCEGDEIHEMMC